MRRTLLALLLACSLLAPAVAVAAAAGSDLDFAIDQIVQTEMRNAHIPGVSLGIVQGGEIIYLKGFGEASPGRPMQPRTPMRLGPVSGVLTAAAVLQLAESGKLDPEVPVTKYIPWLRLGGPPEAAAQVTVRDLLNHTSGLGARPDDAAETLNEAVYGLREMAPAEGFRYSDLNYDVLALIVEAVSGQPFGQYLQRNLFTPTQMNRSFTDEAAARREFMAEGYQGWFGLAVPTALPEPASAAIIASAEDMARFIASGKPTAINSVEIAGAKALRIGGPTPTSLGELVLLPDQQAGFVLLTNAQHPLMRPAVKRMAEQITALLAGRPAPATAWWHRYAWGVWDVACLAALGLIIWSLESLLRWRKQLEGAGARARHRVALGAIGLHLAVALALTYGIPALAGGSWVQVQRFMPDLGRLAAAAVLANFAGAAARLLIAFMTFRKQDRAWKESSEKTSA